MSNKSLPRNVKKIEMAKNNDFYQRLMIDAFQLLRVWLLLHNVSHLITVSKQKEGEIQHLYPCKLHEEPDMLSVQPRKSALRSEIFDDNPH